MPSVNCPACGAVTADRGECRKCGHRVEVSMRPVAAKLIRTLKLRPADGLEATTDHILQELNSHRFPASFDLDIHSQQKTKRYIRILAIEWAEGERDYVIVCNRKWSKELASKLSIDLLRLDQQDAALERMNRFYIAAIHEPPRPVRYVFSNDLRARFERAALCRVEYVSPAEIIPLAKIPILTELAFDLARTHLGLGLALESIQEIARLEEVVYQHMRRGMKHNLRLPRGEYIPNTSLLLLGLIYGEVVGITQKIAHKWVNDQRWPFGLALSLQPGPGRSIRQNLIGKLTRFYLAGEPESIISHTWAVLDRVKEARA